MALLVSLTKDMVEIMTEGGCIIPLRPFVGTTDPTDLSKDFGIIGHQIVWTYADQAAGSKSVRSQQGRRNRPNVVTIFTTCVSQSEML